MKTSFLGLAVLLCVSAKTGVAQQKLDTVTTTAKRIDYISPALKGFEERRMKRHGRFIGEDELRKADSRRLSDVLMQLSGLRQVQLGASTFMASMRSAGSGKEPALRPASLSARCYVSVFEDGLPLYTGPGDGRAPPDMARLQTREYAGIEFYPGYASLPAEFSMIRQSDCGTLLLWTRER